MNDFLTAESGTLWQHKTTRKNALKVILYADPWYGRAARVEADYKKFKIKNNTAIIKLGINKRMRRTKFLTSKFRQYEKVLALTTEDGVKIGWMFLGATTKLSPYE